MKVFSQDNIVLIAIVLVVMVVWIILFITYNKRKKKELKFCTKNLTIQIFGFRLLKF